MKAQNQTHTPGPWRFNQYASAIEFDGNTIARLASSFGHDAKESNGEFIVRACNIHEDLLAALEDAEFLMRQASKYPGSMQDSFKRSASDARQAIAKAKGETP